MLDIYVYENWSSLEPTLLGTLFVDDLRGKEIFSFEFNNDWLKNNKNYFLLDPELNFYAGKQYTLNNDKLFGFIMNSCPDRWGRTLIKRREELFANKENREVKNLKEIDYLLGISDELRMGALRFKKEIDGPFLDEKKNFEIPPISSIREIQASINDIENDNYLNNYDWLDILFQPGSSLGGARPKANVKDLDGSLWIAKFPSKNDIEDIGAWEMLAHELAILCDINVPEAKIITLDNKTIYLTKRFDRNNNQRIHFASAMTLLNKKDGEDASYLEILDFIKRNSEKANEDSKELWKRILFNVLISNTDDHLRNHGFILNNNAWILSPAYDLNPSIDKNHLSLTINENESIKNINIVLNIAKYFNISNNEATAILKHMKKQIQNNLLVLVKKYNISNIAYQRMKQAFDLAFE